MPKCIFECDFQFAVSATNLVDFAVEKAIASPAATFLLFDDGISRRCGCHEFQHTASWSIITKKFAI
jgi:hypothetical protein